MPRAAVRPDTCAALPRTRVRCLRPLHIHLPNLLDLLQHTSSSLLQQPANLLPKPVICTAAEPGETCSNLLTGQNPALNGGAQPLASASACMDSRASVPAGVSPRRCSQAWERGLLVCSKINFRHPTHEPEASATGQPPLQRNARRGPSSLNRYSPSASAPLAPRGTSGEGAGVSACAGRTAPPGTLTTSTTTSTTPPTTTSTSPHRSLS